MREVAEVLDKVKTWTNASVEPAAEVVVEVVEVVFLVAALEEDQIGELRQ